MAVSVTEEILAQKGISVDDYLAALEKEGLDEEDVRDVSISADGTLALTVDHDDETPAAEIPAVQVPARPARARSRKATADGMVNVQEAFLNALAALTSKVDALSAKVDAPPAPRPAPTPPHQRNALRVPAGRGIAANAQATSTVIDLYNLGMSKSAKTFKFGTQEGAKFWASCAIGIEALHGAKKVRIVIER